MSQDQETTPQESVSKPADEESPSQAASSKPPDREALVREIISTRGVKQQSDPKTTEDLEKLRRDQYELRDRINSLRENDLLLLKEKTSTLNAKFAGAALIIALLGFFGVKLYFLDLDRLIKERITERTDKALAFNKEFVRASTLYQVKAYDDAIEIYQKLYDENPEEELLFYSLLNCLNQVDRYDDAMRPIDFARKNGFLPGKYQKLLSFNNAGYFVMIKSVEDPSLRPLAEELLREALKKGDPNDKNKGLPLYNLAIYYAMIGKLDEAKQYGRQYRHYESADWQWSPSDQGQWFARLQKVKPSINEDLKTAFAK